MEALSISTIDPRIQRALEDYLEMGVDRSTSALYRMYRQRVVEDPTATVPTTDLTTLSTWEAQYGWKNTAFEYDSVTKRAFRARRKKAISAIANQQLDIGNRLLDLAEASIEKMQEDQKVLNTQDTLSYLRLGMDLQRKAQEQILILDDPSGEAGESGDYMTALRNMVFNSVGQVNVQVNNTFNNTPPMHSENPPGLILVDDED